MGEGNERNGKGGGGKMRWVGRVRKGVGKKKDYGRGKGGGGDVLWYTLTIVSTFSNQIRHEYSYLIKNLVLTLQVSTTFQVGLDVGE